MQPPRGHTRAWLTMRNRAGRTLARQALGCKVPGEGSPGWGGPLCQCGWDWGEPGHAATPRTGGPPHPHLRPTARPCRVSGFHHVSQQSGCDIMRQAGVSGVTSRGPDVWKSQITTTQQRSPTLDFPSGPLQSPRGRDRSGQAP